MVTANLRGGLGNYLFQIGAASTLAMRHDDIAVFDFSASLKVRREVHHDIHTYENNILRNINNGIPVIDCTFIEPRDFSYSHIEYAKNILLDGYFQSDKYLHRKYVLDLFAIDPISYEHIASKYSHILENTNTVSVHVRRGDYMQLHDKHTVQDMSYYNNAFSHFIDATFIVFSDDIEWCKQNFKDNNFIFIENEHDYIDLYLMSLCKHNIIANSTFSWWGAYLNLNTDKKVIAPSKWFGPRKKLITDNIYCDNWIII